MQVGDGPNQTSKHLNNISEQAKTNHTSGSNRRCRIAGRIADAARECRGYPLCLARARYCTTPHRNFDGLASLACQPGCLSAHMPTLAASKGDGLDGRLDAWVGRPVALISEWFLGGSLAPF